MTWLIDPTVTIGGHSYTSQTLNGLTVTYGRTTIWEQPRAGYASIQIKNDTNNPLDVTLNSAVIITVDNYTGTQTTVFTGKVTSISNTLQSVGSSAKVVIHNIIAYAPMADMARVITHTGSYPKEYDDARLNRILTASGVTIDVVDSPGVYEFTSIGANSTDSYTDAAYYAQMAFGYIYETTDGKVGYANESRRTIEAASSGYMAIPTDVILGPSLNSQINTSNLINSVRLEYKASAIVTASSSSSIATYGTRATDFQTELEDATQAQIQADRYIGLRSTPQTVLQSFGVQLSALSITSGVLNGLIGVYIGKPIEVAAFPNGIYNGVFKGFVEGWTLTISQNSASINLNVSKNTLSLTPTRWQDVSASLVWSGVTPTLEWADYE